MTNLTFVICKQAHTCSGPVTDPLLPDEGLCERIKAGFSKKKKKIDWRGQMNRGINLQKLRGRVSKNFGALPVIAGGEDIYLISVQNWQQYTLKWSRPNSDCPFTLGRSVLRRRKVLNMRKEGCMTKYSNYMAYFWIQERLRTGHIQNPLLFNHATQFFFFFPH